MRQDRELDEAFDLRAVLKPTPRTPSKSVRSSLTFSTDSDYVSPILASAINRLSLSSDSDDEHDKFIARLSERYK
jgi:hypothetical protein